MKVSHLHVAFKDPDAATQWFKTVLGAKVIHESPQQAIFQFGEVDFVVDRDWGQGDTSMTFALKSENCQADYDRVVAAGAKPRTPPRDKGMVIGADVFGPGKLVVEFEQAKN